MDIDKDIQETTSNTVEKTEAGPETSSKVELLLKATGDAPIMKKKKFSVDPDKTIGWVITFIRRYLRLTGEDSLFVYVNQAFAPNPDQVIRNLVECFGSDGKLVLYYAKSQAWGWSVVQHLRKGGLPSSSPHYVIKPTKRKDRLIQEYSEKGQ